MIDLAFFCWRERVVIDGDERLLIPRSDPMNHEFPVNLTWQTADEAYAFRAGLISVEDDPDTHEARSWELVRYVGRIVPDPEDELMLELAALDDLLDGLADASTARQVVQTGITVHSKLQKCAAQENLPPRVRTEIHRVALRVLEEAFGIDTSTETAEAAATALSNVTPPDEDDTDAHTH